MPHPSQTLPVLGLAEASTILHEPVYALTAIGQGVRSRVYRAETEEGLVRIIRLTPKGAGRVAREAWVRSKLRKNPRVPLVAEISVEESPLAQAADIVVMSQTQGTTMFAATRTMFEPEVRDVYQQFGEGLATIHSVAVDGYGLIDASGAGGFSSWPVALEALARASLEEARITPLADLVPRAEQLIGEKIKYIQDEIINSCLIHGDAQPMNVQVFRGKIVAFFDFEFAMGGDPLYELAYVEPLFESSTSQSVTPADLQLRREAFYRGYENIRPGTVLVTERIRLYRLIHALRGTEFLSVVGPQLAAPVREETTRNARTHVMRWLS